MRRIPVFLFICAALALGTKCAKILAVFPFNGKSHFIVFEALLKSLAARGHEVVVVSHYPQKSDVQNYTDIDVSGTVPDLENVITIDLVKDLKPYMIAYRVWETSRATCRTVMDHSKVQQLLKSTDQFDLVMTEIFGSECSIGFAHKFNAPLVHIVSSVSHHWTHARIGNPDHPAYVPSYFMPYSSKMNFWQRLQNTLYNILLNIGYKYISNNPSSLLMKEYFGDDVPSIEELASNASLVLVNSHYSINWPRPTVPAFVEVGGMHIQQPKKLPQKLQQFFEESSHGVVYFNLGTLVQVQTFPSDKLQALLDVFGALKERVLMKYTGDSLPGKPENVMISKWIPQLDVLCHPKTKVFISHGGLGSVQETVYAGVPVVGIPLFADQGPNINNLHELGMATKLEFQDITKESLLTAVRTVIDNTIYKDNAKKVSAIFRDRTMTALDTAVYWVEYVIRHKGAPHLRSAAADMPLYQYLLLDVILFILITLTVCVCILYYVIKTVIRALKSSKTAKSKYKSKQQ